MTRPALPGDKWRIRGFQMDLCEAPRVHSRAMKSPVEGETAVARHDGAPPPRVTEGEGRNQENKLPIYFEGDLSFSRNEIHQSADTQMRTMSQSMPTP